MERSIECTIITPERTLYSGEALSVTVQAHDGELGILYNHAPIISELGIGEVRLMGNANSEYLYIEGGIVELQDNKLIVLAENAMLKSELKQDELEAKQKELEEVQWDKSAGGSMKLLKEKEQLRAKLKVALR
jgi:F-type H+-transporting ATPase subunit epsilon